MMELAHTDLVELAHRRWVPDRELVLVEQLLQLRKMLREIRILVLVLWDLVLVLWEHQLEHLQLMEFRELEVELPSRSSGMSLGPRFPR